MKHLARHQKKTAVLLEHEKLTQERFFFLKEPELRKRKFTIEQRRRSSKRDTKNGKERKQAIQELKALQKKLKGTESLF